MLGDRCWTNGGAVSACRCVRSWRVLSRGPSLGGDDRSERTSSGGGKQPMTSHLRALQAGLAPRIPENLRADRTIAYKALTVDLFVSLPHVAAGHAGRRRGRGCSRPWTACRTPTVSRWPSSATTRGPPPVRTPTSTRPHTRPSRLLPTFGPVHHAHASRCYFISWGLCGGGGCRLAGGSAGGMVVCRGAATVRAAAGVGPALLPLPPPRA